MNLFISQIVQKRKREIEFPAENGKYAVELYRYQIKVDDGENGSCDGGIADGAGDHRIVMSAAVASVISKKGVLIKGSEAVGKSYGDFFEAIRNCGAVPSGKDE